MSAMIVIVVMSAASSAPVHVWSLQDPISLLRADRDGNVYRTLLVCNAWPSCCCSLEITKINADSSHVWSRTLRGISGENWYGPEINPDDVAVTSDGRVFVVGSFSGTVDFNPSENEDPHTAGGNESAFILQLGPDGEYLGTQVLQSVAYYAYTLPYAAVVDSAGNLFIAGSFQHTDFDPGPGTDIRFGYVDGFVTKLATDGSYLWTRTWGSMSFAVFQLELDPEENVVLSGQFRNTVDFDWGPGQDLHTAVIPGATFISKMTNDGDFLWARSLQISPNRHAPITVDDGGNVWTAGTYSDIYYNPAIDFDPTEGEDWRAATGIDQIFITKLTGDGEYLGTSFMPSTEQAWIEAVDCDESGGLLLIGVRGYSGTTGTIDLDPGPGKELHSGSAINFLVRLNSDASFDWARIFNLDGEWGQSWMEPSSLSAGPNQTMTLGGRFTSVVDFDPGCAEALHQAPDDDQGYFVLRLASPTASPDNTGDGAVDVLDYADFSWCCSDPSLTGEMAVCQPGCYTFDFDHDDDIDLADFAAFQRLLTP